MAHCMNPGVDDRWTCPECYEELGCPGVDEEHPCPNCGEMVLTTLQHQPVCVSVTAQDKEDYV